MGNRSREFRLTAAHPSRTVVDRRLVPFEEIGKETITVTFGNGTSGEYPLAPVTFDGEEYNVKAAVVQGLPEDVLLGRDVPLHKHIVKRLPKKDQVELLKQLARDHQVTLEDCTEEETVLAVTTRAQKKRLKMKI